jgi:O-antigen ligase
VEFPEGGLVSAPGAQGFSLHPAGPTGAERAALRVLQLGALAVVLAASTYKVFDLDRYFVPKELALHLTALIAGLLASAAFRRTALTRLDLLLLGYLVVSGLSAALAGNGWLAFRALAVSASGIALFWTARALRDAGLARPLLTGLALAVVAGTVTALLQTYGVRTDLFSLNRAPGGALGNRNFVAHLAAFGLPVVLLAALRAWRAAGYALGAVGVMLVTASLVLTRSRAGWLALGAVLVVFLGAMLVCPPLRRHRASWARLAGIVLLVGSGVAGALVLPNSLRWNSDNPYLESVKGVANFQEGSGAGRLVQYGRSLRMAAGHPILGVGPGNWPVKYPEYAIRRDPSMDGSAPGMTSNPWPSSDWVAFVSERGAPAALLLALAFLSLAIAGVRRLRRARDADEGLVAAALLGTVAAAGVAGAFDAVLLLAVPSFLVWATLGALWSPEDSRAAAPSPRLQRIALVAVSLLAGAGAARSGAQLVAMGVYATHTGRSWLESAASIDPGNFRIHLRLARGGQRAARCEHARAAHDLFPSAETAAALSRRCR